MADAAAALARAGRLAALPLLLQRHPRALLPSLLDALACVPETEDVKHYAPLLRQVAALRQAPPLQRAPDWAETAPIAAGLREQGRYALLLATEPMAEVSGGWSPPTQRQLAAWACERAQRLDAATGGWRGCGGAASSGVGACRPLSVLTAVVPRALQASCPTPSRCWRRRRRRCTMGSLLWARCWRRRRSCCRF